MESDVGFFQRPFGFAGTAGLGEFRRNGGIAMALWVIPYAVFSYLQSSGLSDTLEWKAITLLIAGFLLLMTVFFPVWTLPLFVRRARSAGIHWLLSVPLTLIFTPLVFLALCFLPEREHNEGTF